MKPASGLVLWFLKYSNALAVTTPWRTIFCIPGSELNAQLLAHEQVHIEQIRRDGAIVWMLKVLYYRVRYGYASNKNLIEQEARDKAGF